MACRCPHKLTRAHAVSRRLKNSHALDQVTITCPGQPPETVLTAEDLALWTGRLACTDPGWTLGSTLAQGVPTPGSQAREPDELVPILAAVHDACDAMSHLASADRRQVRTLASAGQLLTAAGAAPDTLDMPSALAPAPPDRIGALLTPYEFTARASADAGVVTRSFPFWSRRMMAASSRSTR